MIATLVTTTAFTRLATGNFQMLRQFFSKAATETFFNFGANGIQTADLLLHQFTTAIIFHQNFRIGPKIIEQLTGELVNPERFKPVRRVRMFACFHVTCHSLLVTPKVCKMRSSSASLKK